MAVRQKLPGVKIKVWARREASLEKVRALQLADETSTNPAEIASGADLVVFCMPIGAMSDVAHRIADSVGEGTIITDVGSVKESVVEELGPIFTSKAEFIGSHPMAGSEQAGLEAARADLFEGAMTIVTPAPWNKRETVDRVLDFWQSVGCRVAETSPRSHDEAMALVSHLPHLAAAVLVQNATRENPASLDWIGNGFLDTTRVASGPPAMWAEILMENRDAVKKAAQAMIENLTEVTKLLDADETGGVEHYLAEARYTRDRLKKKNIS